MAELIKERLKLQKGSGVPNRDKVGKLTRNDLKEIVKAKKADMRASSDEAAMRLVAGTARSMGVDVEGLEEE